MKKLSFIVAGVAAAWTCSISAQTHFSVHSFNNTGAFQMTSSGAADVEVSTNLQTWTKLATLSQETTLDDIASRRLAWRFYRLHGASQTSSNVVGYVKIPIQPSKLALIGNPFAAPLRLDSAHFRQDVFGMSNPPVKISLYTNGNFAPHTLDTKTGVWTPALRPIRSDEGFAVENLGNGPLTMRLSGEVRQGQFNLSLPAGASLIVPPVPEPGPISHVLTVPGRDGLQIELFNEETQKYESSTFDTLEKGWLPKPPDYKPGRSFVIKTPQPIAWTNHYSVNAR